VRGYEAGLGGPGGAPTHAERAVVKAATAAKARIKLLVATRHVEQQLGRLEPPRKARVQVLEPLHYDLYPERVHVAERAAAKRREADSEYGTDVAIAGRADDSIAQAARGFVQHREDRALLDLHRGHVRASGHICWCGRNRRGQRNVSGGEEDTVHRRINVALLSLLVVGVEPLL